MRLSVPREASSAARFTKGNPLAAGGEMYGKQSWIAADGRKWRTECDSANSGWNGCRSYIQATVIESYISSTGGTAYRWVTREVFNNMVRFK